MKNLKSGSVRAQMKNKNGQFNPMSFAVSKEESLDDKKITEIPMKKISEDENEMDKSRLNIDNNTKKSQIVRDDGIMQDESIERNKKEDKDIKRPFKKNFVKQLGSGKVNP